MEKYQLPPQERSALERLRQPFAVYQFIDRRVVTLVLSDGFCRLFGYEDRAQAYDDMDNDMYKYDHPDDVARIADAAFRFATEGGRFDVIYRTTNRHGPGYRIVHAYGEHVYTDTGVRLAHVWYSDEGPYTEDAGQGSVLNQALSNALHKNSIVKASRYDELTGLPSMTYFFELVEAGKERVRAAGGRPAMMYLDFVGMTFYNARHGFAGGDELLRAFAKLLSRVFRNENCCRVSADHFAVFSEEAGLEQRLQQVLAECRELNGGRALPVHIGVYVSRFQAVHTSVACDRAKLACEALSGKYESAVNYYSQALSVDAVKKQYIIENIDKAISEKWIRVYLQPIIRAVNELICDVEALARWIDPEQGFLSPADFIPALEDAGLIYKLDLYMVEQVLDAIREEEADGFYIVPHSINLSRSDFDGRDMVEEIRRRVDAAGVSRDRITIEITESVIGSSFDFMKEQIERFRALGFPVWMDDFGSGYSSLDVLQSVKFDLIKFDMSFMRKLDEGDSGKIILTELMRMAASLGLDTVCEGVETEEQARFLREIGCSKLQGYHYSRPVSFEALKELRKDRAAIERENPRESAYYESIGRVNLFDLGVIADGDANAVRSASDVLPIAVLELCGGTARYIRSNRAYQEFVRRFFDFDLLSGQIDCGASGGEYGLAFLSMLRQCRESGNGIFFDETMPEGSVVHFFVRRVNGNPVTGAMAVVVAVLSVSEPNEQASYADMARALASDYYSIYIVDLDTDGYITYVSQSDRREPAVERRGEGFFAAVLEASLTRIYKDDRELFVTMLTKENVLRELDEHGVCIINCRMLDKGSPVYISIKITRLQGTNRIILGVSNIDAYMRQQQEEEKLRQEKASFSRIAALSPDYIVLYTVDPETGRYMQYSPSREFAAYGLARQGEDFFADVVSDAPKVIAPEDMERHLRVLTRENMLAEIEKTGYFTHHYRLMMDGKYVPASLKATMVEESDGKRIILGVTNDENAELRRRLEEAKKLEEINKTVTALLDNMPGLAFTKDAKTGVYLACNRAFARYAHRPAPSGVVGLTDAEIFDAETAAHFAEDDRLALSMDKPYIFFEDVPDAAGNQRQFQTTKFQFTDASGRLCLQGMCLDVTDMVRIQRENATTKEAYLQASNTAAVYNHIAHALARDCSDLYYVNMDTDELIEFHTDDARGVLSEARRGRDFFEGCERDARLYLHPDDQEKFIHAMKRDYLARALDGGRVFELTYRLMRDGKPRYVQMKLSRMEDDPRILVIAVSDVDELMRQRRAEERVREERLIYARLHAITGNFIVVYVVDPVTNRYREFSATPDYEKSFERDKEGEDFFAAVRRDARVFAHPRDLDGFLAAFTKENVLAEVERSGIFTWGYRILMDGKPLYVQMKAAMVEEQEGPRLIVGLNDINAQIMQEEEYRRRLAQAQSEANLDALTGVKNKHAFLVAEAALDRQIAEHRQPPFAVVIFDVNGLKTVNDTAGHQSGDRCLRDACKVICEIFKRSPVFRVGGDEFAVLAQGHDYENIEARLDAMRRHNAEAARGGGVVIACGMSKFEHDSCVASVFARADQRMYENKNQLKAKQIE